MTDERLGDDLWPVLLHLPPGSGVIFRHHATPPAERRALFRRIRRIARARRLLLLAAGPPVPGTGRHGRVAGAFSWPAHDRAEALAGKRAGAKLLFVSPLYATSSHPGAPALGPVKAHRIVAGLHLPVIALGGMTERRYRRLRAPGFAGWAAIDAWR